MVDWRSYVGSSAFAVLLGAPISRGLVIWNGKEWALTALGLERGHG